MTVYYIAVGSIRLKICVVGIFKYRTQQIIDELMKMMSSDNEARNLTEIEYVLYICDSDEHLEILGRKIHVCESNESWVFRLIQELENNVVEMLNCTTIHGNFLSIKDECFMLVGARMSGKTTLTQTLLQYIDASLAGDDMIFLRGNAVAGLGTPLLIRSNETHIKAGHINTVDDEGVLRVLIPTKHFANASRWPNYIFFPQYRVNCKPEIERLTSIATFKALMQNVRHHSSVQQLKLDILRLADIPAYRITYQSQQNAINLMGEVLPYIRRTLA